MRRTMIIAAVATLGLLGACDNGTEPAPPPTSEDALTTATVAPTTPDEVEATTDAAPTTTEPTEQATATQTPEADGPPQMPDEATEQTEAGAEAFALHYLELINYTGMHPETGLLEPLAAEGCKSCRNYEENVSDLLRQKAANNAEAAIIHDSTTIPTGSSQTVLVDLEQAEYKVVTQEGTVLNEYERTPSVQFKFTLTEADPWLVEEIQVSTS